jgi:hypothetical protein
MERVGVMTGPDQHGLDLTRQILVNLEPLAHPR